MMRVRQQIGGLMLSIISTVWNFVPTSIVS